MSLLCRFGWHRWRYHGIPVDRRRCATCYIHQHLIKGNGYTLDFWRTDQ